MLLYVVGEGSERTVSIRSTSGTDIGKAVPGGYRRIEPEHSEVFFFDLWCSDQSQVTAIEIHPDESTFQRFRSMAASKCLTFAPYPVVWLTDDHGGKPQGLEAFVGFEIYESPSGSLAVCVDPAAWPEFSFPDTQVCRKQ
jgi:hypothetical protein